MARQTVPDDTDELLAITAGTGLFTPADVDTLREVLADYFAETPRPWAIAAPCVREGEASRSASSTSPRRR